jgi:hypothetical protein
MSVTVRYRSCVRWNTMIHNPIFSCGRMTRNVCHCEVQVVCQMEYKCDRWNTRIHNPICSCGRMTRYVCHCQLQVVSQIKYEDTQSHL